MAVLIIISQWRETVVTAVTNVVLQNQGKRKWFCRRSQRRVVDVMVPTGREDPRAVLIFMYQYKKVGRIRDSG